MSWSNQFSYPFSATSFVRAREQIEREARAAAERRIEWGKRYADLIRRYGQRAINRMSGDKLNALLDGRDGIAVTHRNGEPGEQRWTVQRIEYVRVRNCKGKRT